ncbi:hypothetical protein H4219_001259 [Mycoemilia scoparia]|uniref:Molybdenum cofactor sulfurase n=1 Tax=Mycoemilia scoparia TaxID=417184 RepID=A0A9W8A6G6_9FUNG|nr:hypothetical protein H4219_001259 [Mycoemilia scoparia]
MPAQQHAKPGIKPEMAGRLDYNGNLERIRRTEYPQLYEPQPVADDIINAEDSQLDEMKLSTIYLDHTGATLYSASHVKAQAADMLKAFSANPHSGHPLSKQTSERIDRIRSRLHRFFGVPEETYTMIFTSGTTAAIKLAGEMVPWSKNPEMKSRFMYLRDSHTSVVGLRGLVANSGSFVDTKAVEWQDIESDLNSIFTDSPKRQQQQQQQQQQGKEQDVVVYDLLAYPGQCNFSGQRFPTILSQRLNYNINDENASTDPQIKRKLLVLLDAAALLPTTRLNLDVKTNSSNASKKTQDIHHYPDFITLSFYKIFGMPTGLGALFVKRELQPILQKSYFGGGTVSALVYDEPWQAYRSDFSMKYEDGTPNYQSILSLGHALDSFERNFGSLSNVSDHVVSITKYAYSRLKKLRHSSNGRSVVKFYLGRRGGVSIFDSGVEEIRKYQGGTLALNIVDRNGGMVGYVELERLASMKSIALRVGGHCNPGAMQGFLDLSTKDVEKNYEAGHVCWDDHDVIDGKALGVVRISFGAMTSHEDIDKFVQFIEEYFLDYAPSESTKCLATDTTNISEETSQQQQQQQSDENNIRGNSVELSGMAIYPIKSCHRMKITTEWPVSSFGFLCDRAWMLVRKADDQPMSQKRYPRMAKIHPTVDLKNRCLRINIDDNSGNRNEGVGAHSKSPKDELIIPFESPHVVTVDRVRLCGDSISVDKNGQDHVSDWFSDFLGVSCYLAFERSMLPRLKEEENPAKKDSYNAYSLPTPPPEHYSDQISKNNTCAVNTTSNNESGSPATLCSLRNQKLLSFANESQFLLVTEESVKQLSGWVREEYPNGIDSRGKPLPDLDDCFQYRANIVVKGTIPFEEFRWKRIRIGPDVEFEVQGPCRRCQVMCNDQKTAIPSREPYLTLAKRHRVGGKVVFGVHLQRIIRDRNEDTEGGIPTLKIGTDVTIFN